MRNGNVKENILTNKKYASSLKDVSEEKRKEYGICANPRSTQMHNVQRTNNSLLKMPGL